MSKRKPRLKLKWDYDEDIETWVCWPFIIELDEGWTLSMLPDESANMTHEEAQDCKYFLTIGWYSSFKEAKKYAEKFSRLFPAAQFVGMVQGEQDESIS